MKLLVIGGLIVLMFLAAAAFPRNAWGAGGPWGVGGFVGYHTYAMTDLNDEVIMPINVVLFGTGYSMDEIKSGVGFGGGIRYRGPGRVAVAVDFERLDGGSDLSVPGGVFEITAPANVVSGTALYYFPSDSRLRFGLGGGLGVCWSSGDVKVYDSTTLQEERESMEGTGIELHVVSAMDITLSATTHLEASVGYRYAETSDLKIGGEKALTVDGDDATLDWTGILTRVGYTFYFGSK